MEFEITPPTQQSNPQIKPNKNKSSKGCLWLFIAVASIFFLSQFFGNDDKNEMVVKKEQKIDKFGRTEEEKEIISQAGENPDVNGLINSSYKLMRSQEYFVDTEIIRFTGLSKMVKGLDGEKRINKTRDSLIANKDAISKKQLVDYEKKAAKESIETRKAYGKILENSFLDNGLNIKVTVSGKSNQNIRLTYILFNDVYRRKFETQGYLQTINERGFKRITLSDGFDYEVYYTYD